MNAILRTACSGTSRGKSLHTRAAGMTLMEVMMAVAIFTIVMGALFAITLSIGDTARVQDAKLVTNDEARRALQQLVPELRQAASLSINWTALPGQSITGSGRQRGRRRCGWRPGIKRTAHRETRPRRRERRRHYRDTIGAGQRRYGSRAGQQHRPRERRYRCQRRLRADPGHQRQWPAGTRILARSPKWWNRSEHSGPR
ncbi:MAG: prepilin-type N-terminal cleavage/methylation domain-containing protein [Candidatus Hydrogenedentes bacterium]|nr:prepilin-type N-terminal cleavage/methylation domain-containing protein [Candidatus Hydrogenedentota bacterium]